MPEDCCRHATLSASIHALSRLLATPVPKVSAPFSHALPADSLARAFLLAARVAAVIAAQPGGGGPRSRRRIACDAGVGTGTGLWRIAPFREATRCLGHCSSAARQTGSSALLLCAPASARRRPDAAHTIVDQAVEAAGQLARGAFRGWSMACCAALRRQTSLRSELHGDEAECRHPAWWLNRLRAAYPESWPQIVAAGNAPATDEPAGEPAAI